MTAEAGISETSLSNSEWLVDESLFTLEISEGSHDEAAGEWTGTVTVVKGEESLSEEVVVLTKDYEEF